MIPIDIPTFTWSSSTFISHLISQEQCKAILVSKKEERFSQNYHADIYEQYIFPYYEDSNLIYDQLHDLGIQKVFFFLSLFLFSLHRLL